MQKSFSKLRFFDESVFFFDERTLIFDESVFFFDECVFTNRPAQAFPRFYPILVVKVWI